MPQADGPEGVVPLAAAMPDRVVGRGKQGRQMSQGSPVTDSGPGRCKHIGKSQRGLLPPTKQLLLSSSPDDREALRSCDIEFVKSQREYNRRAQQKCRERQKHKLQESEARAQELQRELEQLKAQKSALEARNVLLERMVGQQESGSQPCLQVQAERTPEEESADEECTELFASSNDNDGFMMPEAWHSAWECHVSVRTGGAVTLSLEQLKSLPLAELAALWRDYAGEMAALLPEARRDPASRGGRQCARLAGELRAVVSGLMEANPKSWSTLRAVRMDPGGAAPVMETPPPNWWRRVYRAMKLTSSQRRTAVSYRSHMLLRMGKTLRARRDIYLALLQRQEGPCPELFLEDPQGGIALAQGLLAAGDAAEQLRRNVAEEQQLHNSFLLAVRAQLDPLQSAIAIVHSFPWCPEPLAIMNCAAEEEGAPQAHELLACPPPGGPIWPHSPLPPGSPLLDCSIEWAPAEIEWLHANLGQSPVMRH